MSNNPQSPLGPIIGFTFLGVLAMIFALSYIADPYGKWSFGILLLVVSVVWLWGRKRK